MWGNLPSIESVPGYPKHALLSLANLFLTEMFWNFIDFFRCHIFILMKLFVQMVWRFVAEGKLYETLARAEVPFFQEAPTRLL